MTVISNFDDTSPAMSGTLPTVSAVGRTGNAATYAGAGHKNFYFASHSVERDNSKVYSAWVRSSSTEVNLMGLCITSAGVNNNGYQFLIDNRNGSITTASLQIRRDASTSAVIAAYTQVPPIENNKWYRVEAQWRTTAPNLLMRVYDENNNFIGQVGATDATYNTTTMYLGGYGHGDVIIDDIEQFSTDPTVKVINYASSANGYKYRKKLTVDGDKVTGWSDNFIALVSYTDPDLRTVANGGKVRKNPLLDIRFELKDGSKLSHQVEKHVDSTGEIIAWVKFPTLDAGTEFYMYYGKDLDIPMSDYSWGGIDTVGIRAGVISSSITARRDSNAAAGTYNLGEVYTYGNSIVGPDGVSLSISDTGGENSGQESGSPYYGYFMYHTAATAGRFTMASGSKRANFALVTYDGTNWKYDNNSALVNFTPDATDLLVAKIKWGGSAGFECFQTLYAGEEDMSGLWHWSQFRGVYHMESAPDGNASTFEQVDSSWYSHPGSSLGSMNSADLVSGKINTAVDFDGSNDSMVMLDTTGSRLRITGDMTISLWVYPRTNGTRRNIIGKAYGGEYEITQEVNNTISTYWGRSGANSGTSGATNGYQGFSSSSAISNNNWSHIVVSRKLGTGGWVRIYINGTLSNSVTPLYTSAVPSTINTTLATGRLSTAWFNGLMDEIRFSQVARDTDWIATEYQNQNNPSAFYSYGPEEVYTPVRKFDGTNWIPVEVNKVL